MHYPLNQTVPERLLEVIQFLSTRSTKGRTQLCSYLLDLGGDWREQIAKSIDDELSKQPTSKRARPLSTHGDVRLTVFCWTEPWAPRNAKQAVDHGHTIMLMTDEPDRLLLELSYDEAGNLINVHWQKLAPASLPEATTARLRAKAQKLRQTRVSTAKARGKIGRNQPCPCGSGKKYKKCCLNR